MTPNEKGKLELKEVLDRCWDVSIGDIFMPKPPKPRRRFKILFNRSMKEAAKKFGMPLDELKARVFSKEKQSIEDAEINDVLEATRADRILHEFCKVEWPGPELLEDLPPSPSIEMILE